MVASTSIDVLVQFSRLASEASSGDEILPLLAQAAIDHVGADAAAILRRVDRDHVRVAVSRGLPAPVDDSVHEADVIDDDAGRRVLAAAGARFARQITLPLISSGAIFGGLVLLLAPGHELEAEQMRIAVALVDLCATALARADHVAKLMQANAELRASREVLARTEKLRALGQMAAGVQHDLRNVLNPLAMHVQIVERALAKGDKDTALASVEECRGVVRRGTEMLDRLRAFSRQSPGEAALEVDLNALAREAVAIARPRMSSRAGALGRIVEELGEVAPVVARGEEVVAAIVNLVVNAIDAMPSGGTITVKTGRTGNEVWVSVADDGPGMTAEVQARVFEPFFTTKGTEGTGLGLAMVFATMQRHRGRVSLESAPGKGATFKLTFPLPGTAGASG
jgi:signal transduction histidine kinase